jgi:hypothetical protein
MNLKIWKQMLPWDSVQRSSRHHLTRPGRPISKMRYLHGSWGNRRPHLSPTVDRRLYSPARLFSLKCWLNMFCDMAIDIPTASNPRKTKVEKNVFYGLTLKWLITIAHLWNFAYNLIHNQF